MQDRWFVSALLLVSIALLPACGGGKRVSNARSPGGEGDDPATPFGDASVKAALRNVKGSAECGVAPTSTLGAHFDAQKQALKGDGMIVTESFRCRARADDRWDCEWGVSAKAAEPEASFGPAPPQPCAENPCADDPCAGEGGGGFMIMATVGSDGSVDPKDVHCVAPG